MDIIGSRDCEDTTRQHRRWHRARPLNTIIHVVALMQRKKDLRKNTSKAIAILKGVMFDCYRATEAIAEPDQKSLRSGRGRDHVRETAIKPRARADACRMWRVRPANPRLPEQRDGSQEQRVGSGDNRQHTL